MKKSITNHHHHIAREKKQIILIGFEGSTENNYFDNFKDQKKNYRIKYAFGNQTDPVNLVNNLYNTIKMEYDSDFFVNHKAFCVFDLDTYKNKKEKIEEAIKLCNKYGIIPITSAPCIELWYLLHFEKCNSYITSDNVIKKLKKHITTYKKGGNIFERLKPNINLAIKNAKELESIHIRNGKVIGDIDTNPNTEMYKIVEYLINKE